MLLLQKNTVRTFKGKSFEGWLYHASGWNKCFRRFFGTGRECRSIRELEVRSPLRECGLTKTEIRRLSREEGLFTWNKPSYACLATRIPAGIVLTEPELQKIEKAEDKLFSLGFTDFRIRLFHGAARIQLPAEQMAKMTEMREEIYRELKPYLRQFFWIWKHGSQFEKIDKDL
mgnify:CR=1 FL=1